MIEGSSSLSKYFQISQQFVSLHKTFIKNWEVSYSKCCTFSDNIFLNSSPGFLCYCSHFQNDCTVDQISDRLYKAKYLVFWWFLIVLDCRHKCCNNYCESGRSCYTNPCANNTRIALSETYHGSLKAETKLKQWISQGLLMVINGYYWSLSDSNGIRNHNHLVHKRTLNHLPKLVSWAN